MTSQTTGYQLTIGLTSFTTVTPGVTGNGNTPTAAAVLPLASSSLKNLAGAQLTITSHDGQYQSGDVRPQRNVMNGSVRSIAISSGCSHTGGAPRPSVKTLPILRGKVATMGRGAL